MIPVTPFDVFMRGDGFDDDSGATDAARILRHTVLSLAPWVPSHMFSEFYLVMPSVVPRVSSAIGVLFMIPRSSRGIIIRDPHQKYAFAYELCYSLQHSLSKHSVPLNFCPLDQDISTLPTILSLPTPAGGICPPCLEETIRTALVSNCYIASNRAICTYRSQGTEDSSAGEYPLGLPDTQKSVRRDIYRGDTTPSLLDPDLMSVMEIIMASVYGQKTAHYDSSDYISAFTFCVNDPLPFGTHTLRISMRGTQLIISNFFVGPLFNVISDPASSAPSVPAQSTGAKQPTSKLSLAQQNSEQLTDTNSSASYPTRLSGLQSALSGFKILRMGKLESLVPNVSVRLSDVFLLKTAEEINAARTRKDRMSSNSRGHRKSRGDATTPATPIEDFDNADIAGTSLRSEKVNRMSRNNNSDEALSSTSSLSHSDRYPENHAEVAQTTGKRKSRLANILKFPSIKPKRVEDDLFKNFTVLASKDSGKHQDSQISDKYDAFRMNHGSNADAPRIPKVKLLPYPRDLAINGSFAQLKFRCGTGELLLYLIYFVNGEEKPQSDQPMSCCIIGQKYFSVEVDLVLAYNTIDVYQNGAYQGSIEGKLDKIGSEGYSIGFTFIDKGTCLEVIDCNYGL